MENKNGFFEKSEFSNFFRSGKTKQWLNRTKPKSKKFN